MIVSVRLLKKYGACEEQVKLFAETFGSDAEVTVTAALCREHASKFDLGWAVQNLFTPPLRAEFDAKRASLRAEYLAKHTPLWEEYDAKWASLWEEYDAKCAELFGTLAERM